MKILLALGGNALLQRGQTPDAQTQVQNAQHAAKTIRKIAKDHQIVFS